MKSIINKVLLLSLLVLATAPSPIAAEVGNLRGNAAEEEQAMRDHVVEKKEEEPEARRLLANVLSADGRYEAIPVGQHPNVHYEVRDRSSGSLLFTTHAQYSTPNDVKAGIFLFDSRLFAAAYHYGHDGGYTWIGIWDTEKKYRIQSRRKDGWVLDLSFLSNDQNLKQFYGPPQPQPSLFFFKIECPSWVTPCYTTAFQATDKDVAKNLAQNSATNCKVTSITEQQYYEGC